MTVLRGNSWLTASATIAIASVFGILVGLASFEHGIFEMLQGNITPDSFFIDAMETRTGSGLGQWNMP